MNRTIHFEPFIVYSPSNFVSTGLFEELQVFSTKTDFLSGWQSNASHGHPNGQSFWNIFLSLKFKPSEINEIFRSSYLTWALIILFFEQSNTGFLTRFIVFAINNALAKINTFFLFAFLQIIFILRRRVFTTNANGIRATITTIRAVDITWTILKNKLLRMEYSLLKSSIVLEGSNLKPKVQSVSALPHSMRHSVLEQPRVQST